MRGGGGGTPTDAENAEFHKSKVVMTAKMRSFSDCKKSPFHRGAKNGLIIGPCTSYGTRCSIYVAVYGYSRVVGHFN